jgi:hypothetical protein
MTVCEQHPTMCEKLDDVNSKLDRVINGIYGRLDEPDSGFIKEIKFELSEMRISLNSLLASRRDSMSVRKTIALNFLSSVFGAGFAIGVFYLTRV